MTAFPAIICRLRRDYGPAIISCGDVLRSHIAAGTEEGRLAEREMSRGGLVSDEIALRVMGVALEEMTTKVG